MIKYIVPRVFRGGFRREMHEEGKSLPARQSVRVKKHSPFAGP